MHAEAPARHRGPTALTSRALGPDLARGCMLLLIALANAHGYLHGHPVGVRGYPERLDGLDAAVTWLLMTAVDGRAYPFFALLLGYGLVQLLRRLERAGEPPGAARSLLRRRGRWLVVLGLLHALLLFSGDVLGAYGLVAVLLAGTVLGSSDRRLLVAAGLWGVLAVLLAAAQGFPAPAGTESLLPSLGTEDPLRAAALRLVEWAAFTLFGAGIVAAAVLAGAWAARRGLLDQPERHARQLRTGAVAGLLVGLLGAQPLALMAAQWWDDPSVGLQLAAAVLHSGTGYAAGAGYACLGGLLALRLRDRRGPVVRSLVATGQRSLTCYLTQSVVFVAALAAYGGGLGDDLGVAEVTVIAVLTWAGTVLLATALARGGHRGPFEALLRRWTYGRSPRQAGAQEPADSGTS